MRSIKIQANLSLLLLLLAASPCAAGTKTVVFFGDSLTAGFGLPNPDSQSFPALIGRKIKAEHIPWKVVNAGLSGETSAGGLRRLDWVLKQPVDVLVLELGANDGLRGIDPAVTRGNLKAIIEHVHREKPGVIVVLAGMKMPPTLGDSYSREFADVFPKVAAEEHAVLIPFLLEGVGGVPSLNQADEIHPSPAGAAIVAETVWKTLKPILEPSS